MRNIFRTTVFLGLLSVLFSVIITCIKVEKKLMVATGQVNNVLPNTAQISGTVVDIGEGATQHGHCYGTSTNDGGAPVTARGVCWSTSTNPTVALTTKLLMLAPQEHLQVQ